MIKYLLRHFQRTMTSERGFIQALAFLANPAFWAGVGNVLGGVAGVAGAGGGGGGSQAQPIASNVPSAGYSGGGTMGMAGEGGGHFQPSRAGLGEEVSLGGIKSDIGREGGELTAATKSAESATSGSTFMKDLKGAVASKVASAVVSKLLSGSQPQQSADQAPMSGQVATQTPSAGGMAGAIGFQTPEMKAQLEARRRQYGY